METVMMVDRGQTREAVQEVAGRVAELVRPLADTGMRLPADEWTVGEAAAHLAVVGPMFSQWAAGAYEPYGDGTSEGLARFREIEKEIAGRPEFLFPSLVLRRGIAHKRASIRWAGEVLEELERRDRGIRTSSTRKSGRRA